MIMPKMKVETLPKEKKDFFYEILGTMLVLIGIILIGRFGSVGAFCNTVLHILFGDYVFVLLILMVVFGIRGIVKKKFVNITSINFLGFWLLYFGLSLFCCFSLQKGLQTTSRNYFSSILGLYKRYLSNYKLGYSSGGGILGGLIFQGLTIFFGQVGVYLFAIVLSGMGLFFLSGLTFFNLFKKRRGILKLCKSILLRIICFFKRIEIPKRSSTEVKVQTSILSEAPKNSNFTIQKEYNQELLENFTSYIKRKQLSVEIFEVNTSYYSSRFILSLQGKEYWEELRPFFLNRCFHIQKENRLFLDYTNKFKSILSLKSLISMGLSFTYPLGVDVGGDVCGWENEENHLFIIGDYKEEVDQYIKALLVMIHLNNGSKTRILFATDDKNFLELKTIYTVEYILDLEVLSKTLDEVIEEYEKREELLRYLNLEKFADIKYNKNVMETEEIFIIIRMKLNLVQRNCLDKINFLIKNAARFGIYLIVVMNYVTDINCIERQNQPVLLFKTTDILMSLKILNQDSACYLNKNGEALFLENKKISHLALGYVTDLDYQNVLKKFTG